MTADSERLTDAAEPEPRLILCALDESLAAAWREVADDRAGLAVHQGSVLDLPADAVVSPANSYGWMRGGVDAVYARTFPEVEQQVRSAVLAYHGGELPVGEALLVPTGVPRPSWLISAPTMRVPGEQLPADTVHPYLAARALLRLWFGGALENGTPVRRLVRSVAMPGLGTGIGGAPPELCAHQVAAAWDEVFAPANRPWHGRVSPGGRGGQDMSNVDRDRLVSRRFTDARPPCGSSHARLDLHRGWCQRAA